MLCITLRHAGCSVKDAGQFCPYSVLLDDNFPHPPSDERAVVEDVQGDSAQSGGVAFSRSGGDALGVRPGVSYSQPPTHNEQWKGSIQASTPSISHYLSASLTAVSCCCVKARIPRSTGRPGTSRTSRRMILGSCRVSGARSSNTAACGIRSSEPAMGIPQTSPYCGRSPGGDGERLWTPLQRPSVRRCTNVSLSLSSVSGHLNECQRSPPKEKGITAATAIPFESVSQRARRTQELSRRRLS